MGLIIFLIALFTVTPALADPTGGILTSFILSNLVTSGLFAGATYGTAIFAAQAISALISAGVFAGASAILGGGRKTDVRDTDRAQDSVQIPDAPLLVVLGRARVAGSLLFPSAANSVLYRHRAVAAGPISAFEEYYLNRRQVFVRQSDGAVTSPPYLKPDLTTSYAYIQTRMGEAIETAFQPLRDAFPSLITANHRGDHLAQTLSMFEAPTSDEYLKRFPNGKPETEVVIRGEANVYDPRTGTYGWTDNGPLCVLHYLIMPDYKGWGLSADIWDMADIAATADAADVPVALAEGGTEPRSRCSGVYSTDRPRGEVLADILLSTGVQVVRLVTGKYSLRLQDDNPTPDMAIPLKKVKEFEWSGLPSVERPNRQKLRYFDARHDYKTTTLDLAGLRWGESVEEIERVGDRIDEITLNFCQWHGQASRIGRRLWYTRRARRGQVVSDLYGLGTLARPTITVPFVGIGVDINVMPVQPRLETDNVTTTIPFVECPVMPTYDPALDQAPPPSQFPDGGDGSIPEPEFTGEFAQVIYPDDQGEVRAEILSETGYGLEVVVREYSDDVPAAWQPASLQGADCAFGYPINATGERVDFMARHYDTETFETSNFAHLTIDPVAIDNSTPAAPAATNETGGSLPVSPEVEVTGTEYHVAYVQASVRYKHEPAAYGAWIEGQTATLRPNQVVTLTAPAPAPPLTLGDRYEVRAISYTSNDTPGAEWTAEVIIT